MLCGLLVAMGCMLDARETVVVGVFVHSPYVEAGSGTNEVKGAGIDYITRVLKDMNCVPKFVVMPFPRVIASLESGEIDMAFDLAKTSEREVFAYYADKPAMKVSPVFILSADSRINSITSINDLKGLTVGAVLGVVVPKFLDVPNIFKFDYATGNDGIKQNLNKLLVKRFDLAFDYNPYSMMAEAKKAGVQGKLKVIPMPGDSVGFYVLVSKKSRNAASLLAEYNRISATGKHDYTKIIEDSLK